MSIRDGSSLAHKMTWIALLTSGIASATLMASFLAYDLNSAHLQMQSHLATLAEVVGENSTAALVFDDKPAAREMLEALRTESPIVTACLYAPAGDLFAEYLRQPAVRQCPKSAGEWSTSGAFAAATRRLDRKGDFAGTIYIESDLGDLRMKWIQLCCIACGLLFAVLILSALLGAILQRRILRPIDELARAMQAVTAHHNFSARVAPAGKDEIALLGHGFNSMLQELEKRAQDKEVFEARLEYQALNDELTGLPNRRLMTDRLNQALAVAARNLSGAALLYIDLDGFKLVNDSLGHSVGDMLLAEVAKRFQSRVRESDTLARLGGDEFAIIMGGILSKEQPGRLARELLETLAALFSIEGHEIRIGASIGISLFPDHGISSVLLLQNADSAMYAAKRAGKSQVAYFSDNLGTSVRERLNLEHELRHALECGGIAVHYQPEFDLGTMKIVRFEALARWNHPTLGKIPPVKFIPIAEEAGLIVELGAYVLEQACREALRWQDAAHEPIQVAVNVSSIQFARETFADEVAEVLHITGLSPTLLQIELTESVLVNGMEHVANAMNRLSNLGVSMAVDDFGTGYSSLSYLPNLPFRSLKIDRSFITELEHRPDLKNMIHSLVMLAHNLGMNVIAEGVETRAQLDLIQKLGGNEVQGFLLGKPTPEPMAFIAAHREGRRTEAAPGKSNSTHEELSQNAALADVSVAEVVSY
jgi:diguanylate cyclase (GGDEF)-like protein